MWNRVGLFIKHSRPAPGRRQNELRRTRGVPLAPTTPTQRRLHQTEVRANRFGHVGCITGSWTPAPLHFPCALLVGYQQHRGTTTTRTSLSRHMQPAAPRPAPRRWAHLAPRTTPTTTTTTTDHHRHPAHEATRARGAVQSTRTPSTQDTADATTTTADTQHGQHAHTNTRPATRVLWWLVVPVDVAGAVVLARVR